MLRLIYGQILTSEGPTDAEAERAAASLKEIAGLAVLSERSVAKPRQTIAALGASLEEARAEVQRITPAGGQIIAEKVLSEPSQQSFVVHAPDEGSALARARELFGPPATVSIRTTADGEPAEASLVDPKSSTIWEAGRKGFLGFGAKPSRYEVVLARKACVERTYFLGWKFVRTVGVEVKSTATLQRCALSDNLFPDQDLEKGRSELRAEGAVGSLALAKLIDTCRESFSAAILWPVYAARDAEPTGPLIEALEAALQTDQTSRSEGGQTCFTAELTGDGRIGWSDRTFHQLKTLGREALDTLKERTSLQDGAAILPGSVIIVCSRCNEPAPYKYYDEFLCEAHYHGR